MGNKVADILAQVLKIPAASVTDELAMKDVEAWDSLKHMEMIVAFEQAYNIEFSFDEIVAMQTVASIKHVLGQKGIGT